MNPLPGAPQCECALSFAVSRTARHLCAMTDNKAPAKWVPALFAMAAVMFGFTLILDATRGRGFDLLNAFLTVTFATLAIMFWRIARKGGKAE